MSKLKNLKKFNRLLFNWHEKNARDYPWRKKKNFYSLLIAEILLQKTNADKVVPSYNEIIKKYSSPQKLSRAKRASLKRIIRPLGLLNKSDVLREMAKEIDNWTDRDVSEENLLKIRGVGSYIARSVLIHHKTERLSLLDPNFIRIYKRVFGLESERSRPRCDKKLWEKANFYMPSKKDVSRYVYAILDFGALVCRAKKPKCYECPMHDIVCSYSENEAL
jgi:A/G-specific adenine glycosylase